MLLVHAAQNHRIGYAFLTNDFPRDSTFVMLIRSGTRLARKLFAVSYYEACDDDADNYEGLAVDAAVC